MHWLTDPIFKHYADFSGRASRKTFWMFQLGILLAGLLGIVTLSIISEVFYLENRVSIHWLFSPLLVGVFLVVIPSIAITVRRLHDTGRSGWWYLISFLPYVGSIFLIVFGCLPSQKGGNAYGPNPHGVDADVLTTTPPTLSSDQMSS